MKQMIKKATQRAAPVGAASCRAPRARGRVRRALDPTFYGDLETFRQAVATGTVDVAKGCRNMKEYHQSLEAVEILASGEVPPRRLADHPLKGKWLGCRECHIGGSKSDWVLVYQKFAEKLLLYLVRTGTHRDIGFEK